MDEHSSEHSGNIFGVQTQTFHIISTNSKLLTTFMTYFPWQSFTIILASALTFLRILQAPDIQLLLQAILTLQCLAARAFQTMIQQDRPNLWMRNLVPNIWSLLMQSNQDICDHAAWHAFPIFSLLQYSQQKLPGSGCEFIFKFIVLNGQLIITGWPSPMVSQPFAPVDTFIHRLNI